VHCESSRELGFALSYTPLLPSKGEKKTVFMVTSGLFLCLFRLNYNGNFCILTFCILKANACHQAIRFGLKIEEYKMAKLNIHGTHGCFWFANAMNYTAYLQTAVFQCTACTIDEIMTSEVHSRVLTYKSGAQ